MCGVNFGAMFVGRLSTPQSSLKFDGAGRAGCDDLQESAKSGTGDITMRGNKAAIQGAVNLAEKHGCPTEIRREAGINS